MIKRKVGRPKKQVMYKVYCRKCDKFLCEVLPNSSVMCFDCGVWTEAGKIYKKRGKKE